VILTNSLLLIVIMLFLHIIIFFRDRSFGYLPLFSDFAPYFLPLVYPFIVLVISQIHLGFTCSAEKLKYITTVSVSISTTAEVMNKDRR